MRVLALIFGVLLALLAVQTRAMDWSALTLNQRPVMPTRTGPPACFSIGYPKGWQVTEDPTCSPNIYDNTIYDSFCMFTPGNKIGSLKPQKLTLYSVWPYGDANAKDAAETFLKDTRLPRTAFRKHLSPIITSAGDSGWLVESEGDLPLYHLDTLFTNGMDLSKIKTNHSKFENVPVIFHDYFFSSGISRNEQAVKIEIMTQTTDSSIRSQLDQLVLQTLRFGPQLP
jgi:hypothetical protein